jgi:hypothetical protein
MELIEWSKGETKTTMATTIAETVFSSLQAVPLKRNIAHEDKHNSPVFSSSPPAPQYSPSSPSQHHFRCFRSKSYDPLAGHRTGLKACGQAGERPCPSGTYRGGLARSLLGWALLGVMFLFLYLFLSKGEMDWIGLVMAVISGNGMRDGEKEEKGGNVGRDSQLTELPYVSAVLQYSTWYLPVLSRWWTEWARMISFFPSFVAGQSNEVGRSMTMADEAGVPLDVVTSSRLLHSREVDWVPMCGEEL